MGDAQLELGDYDAADAAYRRLVAEERSAPTVSRLARLTAIRGEPAQAVALASQAVELSDGLALRPNARAFYRFQLGHHRFGAGDVDGAVAAYEEALAIDPAHPGAAEGLAFALAGAGRLTEAAERYRLLVETGPAADLHGLYADVLRALGDDREASRQEALGLDLAADTIGRNPAERRHLVGFYLDRDPELAVELARADAETRQDVGAHDTLAWALHHAGRHREAAEVIDRALAVGTGDAAVLYHAAAIAAATGDHDGARQLVDRALARNPHFHPTEAGEARELRDRLAATAPGTT